MPSLSGWEIVLIVAVIVLLFGARKLPEAARGLGRSLRIFKAEIKDPNDTEGRDEGAEPLASGPQPTTVATPAITAPPVAPTTPVLPVQPVPAPVQPVVAVEPNQQVPYQTPAQPDQTPVQQGQQSPPER